MALLLKIFRVISSLVFVTTGGAPARPASPALIQKNIFILAFLLSFWAIFDVVPVFDLLIVRKNCNFSALGCSRSS